MLCLPEIPFDTDRFLTKAENLLKQQKSIVFAVSEGIKQPNGKYVCELSDDARFVDAFGHKNLTGTARYLSNIIMKRLGIKARSIELSTLQRCAGHVTSRTDITEAYQVGGAAAKAAFEEHTGEMIALKRLSNDPYQCTTKAVDIHTVANFEKKIPLEWINESYTDMLPVFHQYARPLIQAELTPIYINGLPRHIYLKEL
jgi:6-phosphofructokinase 1